MKNGLCGSIICAMLVGNYFMDNSILTADASNFIGQSSEEKASTGTTTSSEEKASTGTTTSSEEKASTGTTTSSEEKASTGTTTSSEEKASTGTTTSSEEKASTGTTTSSEEKASTGTTTSSEEKASTGTTTSSEEKASILNDNLHYSNDSFLINPKGQKLNGYSLPLLSSYKDSKSAALIYELIVQMNKEKVKDFNQYFCNTYRSIYTNSFVASNKKVVHRENIEKGEIIYKGQQLIGLYLGDQYYLKFDSNKGKIVIAKIENKNELSFYELVNCELSEYGNKVLKSYPAIYNYRKNEETEKFIAKFAEQARKVAQENDIFASVMIAQAILESNSGKSSLGTAPYYNLFGMKDIASESTVNLPTYEEDSQGNTYKIDAYFKKYSNYKESLKDYVHLIKEGITNNKEYYKSVWASEAKNYVNAAAGLTRKYATDNNYHKKLVSLIKIYDLTQYDEKIEDYSSESNLIIQDKDNIPNEYKEKMKFPSYNGKNYNFSGSYSKGQCTWYVYNRVKQLGKTVDDYMGNGGEWAETAKIKGYKVSIKPEPGMIASFKPGSAGSDVRYGHVAFVEAIGENGILISEGNVVNERTISYRIINNDFAYSSSVTYISPK